MGVVKGRNWASASELSKQGLLLSCSFGGIVWRIIVFRGASKRWKEKGKEERTFVVAHSFQSARIIMLISPIDAFGANLGRTKRRRRQVARAIKLIAPSQSGARNAAGGGRRATLGRALIRRANMQTALAREERA